MYGGSLTQTLNTGAGLTLSGFSVELHANQVLPANTGLSTALAGPAPYSYGFVSVKYQLKSLDPSVTEYASAQWSITSFHQVSAVPEPSTISLLIAGLITLLMAGMRRRHASKR